MSNKELETISVGLVSLGCSKNLVDTQVMCGVLLTEGLELSPSPDEADAVLINTCAFIQDARDEADFEIRRACGLKKAGNVRAVVVTGCLPQRYGAELATRYPEVDAWVGIDKLEEISSIIRRSVERTKKSAPIAEVSSNPTGLFSPRIPSLAITQGPFAYLKIAEGCNHACAYCAIPQIRGKLRSRSIDDIREEAFALLCSGKKELDIVAQDVTAYGRDKRNGPRLADLVRDLNSIHGHFWLRLLYGYPSLVDDDLLDAFKSCRHLCKYIDIPIQHSHPDILRAMRRAETIDAVASLPSRLRGACRSISLRTTCLVGFPGETDEHFRHLMDYLEKARFDNLGVFVYSPEENTHAAELPGRVPPEVAEKRRDAILRLQKRIAAENNAARVGKKTEALLIRPLSCGRWEARTMWQAPEVDGVTIVTKASPDAVPGDFVQVKITGAKGYDLKAEALG